jgi:hypothetical protein
MERETERENESKIHTEWKGENENEIEIEIHKTDEWENEDIGCSNTIHTRPHQSIP